MKVHIIGDGCLHINTYLENNNKDFTLQEISVSPGSSATNVARQLNNLKVPIRYHGLVGDDELGDLYCSLLAREGISDKYITRWGFTTKVLIGLDKKGAAKLTVDAYPVETMEIYKNISDIQDDDFVYIPGFPNYEDIIDSLSDKRLFIFSDIGFIPYSSDWNEYKEKIVSLSSKVDVILASGFSFGHELFKELQEEVKGNRCQQLIITFGGKGIILVNNEGISFVETKLVETVNPIGAGDCFFAGIIYGFINNLPITETVKYAHLIAALKIQHLDKIPSIKDLEQQQKQIKVIT